MQMKKLFDKFRILKFLQELPHSITDDIKKHLKVIPEKPPSRTEKDLYLLISSLEKSRLIQKCPIKEMRPGGPRFTLVLTDDGIEFLKMIQSILINLANNRENSMKETFSSQADMKDLLEELSDILDAMIYSIFEEVSMEITDDKASVKSKISQIKIEALKQIKDLLN